MRISEAAVAAGCSPRMVRYYHRTGVLPEPPRSSNGYRDYTVNDVARLVRLTTLTAAGIPAASVSDLSDQRSVLKDALIAVEARIDELQHQHSQILSLLDGTAAVPPDISELLDGLRQWMAERGTDSGQEVSQFDRDAQALGLMTDTYMTTADTWIRLRSTLASEQARVNSLKGYQAWSLLGDTTTGDPEVPELVACCRRGLTAGVFAGLTETLRPGSLPLSPADIPVTGAQSAALPALLSEVAP